MRIRDLSVAMSPESLRERLELPAAHGAASQVLALMPRVDEALARLQAGEDPEALHDFRVAVRRLRAWLRGFESVVAVRSGTRRRMRTLARRTNAARDAEAAYALLQLVARSLPSRSRGAVRSLEAELGAEIAAATARIARRAGRRWRRVSMRLRRELMDRQPATGIERGFGTAWAEALEAALGKALDRRAAAVEAAEADDVHRYRIALKRLRYLVEPLADSVPAAAAAAKQTKRVQEITGTINDLQNFLARLERRARDLAAERGETLFRLRLAGRDAEARRVAGRILYRTGPLVALARAAGRELEQRRRDFAEREGASSAPRYEDAVRAVIAHLSPADSCAEEPLSA